MNGLLCSCAASRLSVYFKYRTYSEGKNRIMVLTRKSNRHKTTLNSMLECFRSKFDDYDNSPALCEGESYQVYCVWRTVE